MVCLENIHHRASWWGQHFVHTEQGPKPSSLVMGSNAGIFNTQVLQTQSQKNNLISMYFERGIFTHFIMLLYFFHGNCTNTSCSACRIVVTYGKGQQKTA